MAVFYGILLSHGVTAWNPLRAVGKNLRVAWLKPERLNPLLRVCAFPNCFALAPPPRLPLGADLICMVLELSTLRAGPQPLCSACSLPLHVYLRFSELAAASVRDMHDAARRSTTPHVGCRPHAVP